MKKIINILIISFAVIAALFGGLLIAAGCSCTSSAGGLKIDLSHIFSFFGLFLLIIGMLILIKKTRKHTNILHICIFIYGILLMCASIFINFDSRSKISKLYTGNEFDNVIPANDFGILVASIAVIGLLIYPFIKENKK